MTSDYNERPSVGVCVPIVVTRLAALSCHQQPCRIKP
jgi:hypothetical protein